MAYKVVDPKTYAKNVIKSAGYITAQSLKGVDSDLTNFIKESGSSAKEMYGFLKDFRGNVKRTVNNVLGETGFDDLRRIKSNALDDLRTGKFYNAERENAENSAMMSKLGFSFDFDDLDFDVDEGFGEKKDEETAGVTESTAKSLADKIAEVQRGSSAASAAKIAKGARVNTAAMMAFEQKMFGQVTSSIAAVHGSILNLHRDLATPLNTHIINSANFYQAATTELAKQTSLLENINKMLTDRFAPPKHGFNRGKSAFEQVFGGGFPNLSTWGKIAKNRALQEVGVDMIGGMLNPEMMSILLSQASGSPIAQLAILGLTAGMQKSRFGKSVNRFSNTLKGGFMNTAARISNYARKNRNSSSLPAILARMFDIAPGLTKSIDFGKYNKGRAEWTGQDSRALQVVIPTQLAQILSALTGQEAKIYDYKAGKFVTARMAGNQFRKERTAAIGRATGGFKQEILQDFIDQDKAKHKNDNTPEYTMNSRAVRNLSRDYDTLMSLLSMHNVDVSQFKKKGDITRFCIRMGWVGNARTSGTKPFFFDRNSIMRIDAAIFRKPGTTGNLAGAMYAGRVGNNNFMADAANGNMAFFAGSDIGRSGKKMSIAHQFLDALDDKGNNVFFYLQDYYKQLRMIANNTRFGTGTSSGESTGGASSRGSRGAGWQNPEVVNRSRNRSTRTRGAAPRYLTADDVDPEGRFRWNSSTESYDRPALKAQSRYTREREKKDGIGAKIINKITDVTNDLFFGGDSEGIRKWWKDNGGLVGTIKNLPNIISNAVRSAIDRAKEYVNGKWNQFKESQWGKDFFGAMKSSVKGFAKDTWEHAKYRAGNVYTWATGGKTAPWAAEVSGSRRGGYVTKSGMISVSEGEYIEPAEYGPSFAARGWTESKNYRAWKRAGSPGGDYWGSFAKGGKAGSRAGFDKLTNEDRETARKMFSTGKTIGEIKEFFRSQNKHNSIASFLSKSKEFRNKAKGFKDKAKDFMHRQGSNIEEALETLFGSPEKYQNIKGNINEAYRAAKVNPPKLFAKGALGALVGAATTGSGLGLLGGFVLGAGHEILQNSEFLSKKLFGEETIDEKTGKAAFKGGILPSKVSVFLKKTFPKMAKGGALGGVLGTLGVAPGGIFGGMVLGAGIELLSTTEGFKKAMFGPEGADGKRRGGILGSIKLRVVDPLIEFTKNGLQKIGDFVKKNMFDPIVRFGKAAKDWIKGKTKSIVANVTDKLKEKVKATVGQKVDKLLIKPLSGAAKWVGSKALGATKAVVSAPFRFVGNTLGGALEQHNIRKGYSTKSVDERLAMEGQRTKGLLGLMGNKVSNLQYTKNLAGMSEEEREAAIEQYNNFLNGSNTIKRNMKKSRQDMYERIASSFENGGLDDPAEMKKIRALLSTDAAIGGDLSGVEAYIRGSSLGKESQDELVRILGEKQEQINKWNVEKDTYDKNQDAFFRSIGITDEKAKKKFIKQNRIQAAIDFEALQKKRGAAEAARMGEAQSKDALQAKLKEQEKESPIDAERNNILKQIASVIHGIANHLGVTKDETPKADVSSTAEKLQEKVLPTAEGGKPSLDNKMSSGGTATQKDGEVETHVTPTGDIFETKDVNGDKQLNLSDSGTKKFKDKTEKEERERSKFFGMFTGGGLLAGLKNLLAPKDGEKEGTFWDKLKSIFSSALPGIIAAVVAYFGIKGLGNFAQKNAGGALDPGMNKQKDAEERQQEVEGYGKVRKGILGINMIENKIRKRDMTTYDQDDYVSEYATQRYGKRVLKNAVLSLNKTTAKGVAFGSKIVSKIPIVGKVLAAPLNAVNIGKSIGTRVSKFGKAVGDAGKWVANTKAGKWIGSKVSGAAKSVFSAIGKTKVAQAADVATKPLREKITKAITTVIDFVKRKLGKTATNVTGEAAEAAVKKGAEEAADQCVKSMGKNAAKNLSKVVIIFQLALIANAVTYGFQSAGAKCILGILDEPTLAQKCLAAAINGLNEAIPGIGGLIPSNVIFTIIYSLLKALGMKFTDLDEKRAKAKAEVEQYNKDNGTTYNVEEYVKNVLGELTFQDKVKKTIKGGLRKIGDFFKGKTVADDDAEAAKANNRNKMITDQDIRSNYQALNNKTASITTASGSKTVSGSSTAGSNTAFIDSKAMTGTGSGIIDFTGGASGARLNIKEAAHNIATKIGGVASTAAGYVSKFRSGIINLFTGETEGIPNTDSLIQALWEYTDPTKKLDDFDDTVRKFLSTGITPFGAALVSGISSIMKMAISLTRPLKTIAATMGTDIANAALVADAITSGGLTGESGTTAAIGGIRGTLNNFKNSVKSFGNKAWNWLKGNGFTEDTGSGSQPIHTTQKGNFDRFGRTTIDENGCGPAVAATVLKAYGKNVGIKTAADYASSNGYVAGSSGVGTRASYFGDILGRSGIRTAYTDNNKAIRKAVASGSPTILLGQDKANRSKANSPFGPNPHYVVARGTDRRGNIYVDDPELGRTALYKSNILKNAKLGVATGGASGVEGVISEFTGNVFGLASEKLGDSLAGRVLRTIFSSSSDNEGSDEEGSSGSSYGSSGGTYVNGGGYSHSSGKFEHGSSISSRQYINEVNPNVGSNTNKASTLFKSFTAGNLDLNTLGKYKYWYQTNAKGGLYKGDPGVPPDSTYDVIDSAVGWACARFNHIYTLLTKHSGMAFPDFICDPKDFPKVASSYGISLNGTELAQSPQVGAIMVWGPSPNGGGNAKGHVAIVEKVESSHCVITSESGYATGHVYSIRREQSKCSGRWGMSSVIGGGNPGNDKVSNKLVFLGFIYNPAIVDALAVKTTREKTIENSPLTTDVIISPNKTPRTHPIDTITIHCTGGHGTARAIGSLPHFCGTTSSYGRCSSNYGIGDDGSIGLYAPENYRSWCSGGDRKVNGMSGGDNDDRAITIEVCCDPNHPYAVTDAAYNATIRLLADVCLRNGIKKLLWKNDPNLVGQVDKQNMTVHRWWANKACPGDFLMDHMGDIANQVNKLISGFPGTADKIIGNNTLNIINDQEYVDPSAYGGTTVNDNGYSHSTGDYTPGNNVGDACYMDSNFQPGSMDVAKTWKFLTSHGLKEKAAAALMGAWSGESGGKAHRVEADYAQGYPGTEKVMKTYQSMDKYCKEFLFPYYDRNGIGYHAEYYKDCSGKYYLPGAGLIGFTGPRLDRLLMYSKKVKKDWRRIDTQLEHMIQDSGELGGRIDSLNRLANYGSMYDAVRDVMANYQGMGQDWCDKFDSSVRARTASAESIYNQYKGTGSGLVGGKSGMGGRVSNNAFADNSGPLTKDKYISIFKKREATLPYGGSELLQTAANVSNPKKSLTYYTGVTKAQYSKNDRDIVDFINGSNSVQASYSAMLNSRMANIPPAVASPSAMGSGIKKFKGTMFDDSAINFTGGKSELAPTSAVLPQQSPVYVGNNSNYTKQLTDMISYVKKIADNTTYNASTPVLIEVVTKAVELLGVIAGNSSTSNNKSMAANAESADFNQYIQDQITQMKAKMETIATTL